MARLTSAALVLASVLTAALVGAAGSGAGPDRWPVHTVRAQSFSIALPERWGVATDDDPSRLGALGSYTRIARFAAGFLESGVSLVAVDLSAEARRPASRARGLPTRLYVIRVEQAELPSKEWAQQLAAGVRRTPNVLRPVTYRLLPVAGGEGVELRWRQRFERRAGSWETAAFTQYQVPAGWDYYWVTFETTPALDRTYLPIFRESMRRFRLLPSGRKATPDIEVVRARWAARASAVCASVLGAVGPLEPPETLEEAQAFVSKFLRLYEGYELGLYRITPLPPDTPAPFPEATQVFLVTDMLAQDKREILSVSEQVQGGDSSGIPGLIEQLGQSAVEENEIFRRLGAQDCTLTWPAGLVPQ